MAISKTNNSTVVWKFLLSHGLTKAGAAGLMGNMHAESGIIPNRVEIICLKRLSEYGYGNYTDASYTQAVDSNRISKNGFLNPIPGKQYGYGLCQWTSPGRKSNFYDFMKGRGKSIGDLEGQLIFLIDELKNGYNSVYKTLISTTSVQQASDKVLKDFEMPSNWSSHSKTRAGYSWEYYNLYANESADAASKPVETKPTNLLDWSKYAGKISNSGHDERNKASGGKAGDQGGEWEIRSWYNRPWDCVLRYPNQEIAQWIALLGIEAANNNLIGYDQSQRDTYWQHLKASNYRPSKITIACEADCSAGVIANVKAVGYLKNIPALQNINATYTGNMRTAFKNAGFQVLTNKKYLTGTEYLLPGDILLNDVHHTATNLGIGKNANFNGSTTENTDVTIDYADKLDKTLAGTYTTTADLNLRSGAGIDKTLLTTIPKGNKVTCYGYYSEVQGTKWLYVIYNQYKGFVASSYLQSTTINSSETKQKESSTNTRTLSEQPKWKGKVTASSLSIRTWAGTEYPKLKSYPSLKKGTVVDVCDTIKANNGNDWYFIKIANSIYGFASAAYIKQL